MADILISVSKNANASAYLAAARRARLNAKAGYAVKDIAGFDGLILAGGMDVEPAFYGQKNRGSRGVDPVRDRAEFALLSDCIRQQIPVLGICRGMQVINVYFGGTLVQHIKSGHIAENGGFVDHVVDARDDMAALYGRRFVCNSAHHQAVGKLGKGLRGTAFCGKVTEAFIHTRHPICGVQFHPEKMADGDTLFAWWSKKI